MMIEIIVPGEPVQFARAGSHGAQRFTPPKQRAATRDGPAAYAHTLCKVAGLRI